ncbi:NAD(P)H-dependent oxidoreductase [Candidatus Woesearchaeota archaeon]|nr:NAD(P)H-dependent oxidoreductase [Candidatus Woesearchaeota archaeon]
MLVKKIIPIEAKVSSTKTTVVDEAGDKNVVQGRDFLKVLPQEEVVKLGDNTLENIKSVLDEENLRGGIILSNIQSSIMKKLKKYTEHVQITSQPNVIKILEDLYDKRIEPKAIIFDYNNHYVNPHGYIHEIYIKQNLHIFRHLPVILIDYSGNDKPMIDKIKVLAVNGSPRKNGETKKMLKDEINKYWTGLYYESSIADLKDMRECLACGGHQKNCEPECKIDDQMKELLPKVKGTDVLLVGSPVYMDLPTARTIAFLSRLTGQTKFNRRAYIGKHASALSPAWCSGTKAVIGALTNALEMMGFEIQGRSSREYIKLWADDKTRGGVPDDFYWPD